MKASNLRTAAAEVCSGSMEFHPEGGKAKPAERRTAAFRIKAPSCEIIEAVSRSDVDAVGAHLETGAGTWKRRLRAFKGRAEVNADHGEALITNSSGFEVLGGKRIDV